MLDKLRGAFMLAFRAFQEGMLISNPEKDWSTFDKVNFNNFDSRRIRYDILWSLYESTAYRNIHDWAIAYKTVHALYKYIRAIYNPSYRLGEYYKSHIWGGQLDAAAGPYGALPVITANEAIRPFIAQLWQWSNFSTTKDIYTLHGSILGDTIIRVVDNVDNNNVYFERLAPSEIAELVKDAQGNIKGYTLMRNVMKGMQQVVFKEVAERDGINVVYRTYLNDVPFDWGNGIEWSFPYGFIPMVHIQHNDVGGEWGWSELHPVRSKLNEVDDIASMMSDNIRKTINAGWFFSGVKKDKDGKVEMTTSSNTTDRPEPGREETRAIYASDPQAKATPLVADLDIPGVIAYIGDILKEIERDYPELRFDNLRASGTVSGEALRVARQPAETKTVQRRNNYDAGLVRLNQMGLSIGGFRNYFPGLSLDSFNNEQLDHSIGQRPVFVNSKLDDLEEDTAFWQAASVAISAGVPLPVWLRLQGWNDKDITAITSVVPPVPTV